MKTASQNNIAALILLAPYSSIEDIVKDKFPYFPIKILLTENIDAMKHIQTIKAPLLVMHGLSDKVIPYLIGQKLFDAASSPKKIILMENEGHEFPHKIGTLAPIQSFLKEKKLSP